MLLFKGEVAAMFGDIKEMRAYNLELLFQLENRRCLFVSCFCLLLFIILSILLSNYELKIYICMMLGRFLNLQANVGGNFDFDA